jgi:hypothetical protein
MDGRGIAYIKERRGLHGYYKKYGHKSRKDPAGD